MRGRPSSEQMRGDRGGVDQGPRWLISSGSQVMKTCRWTPGPRAEGVGGGVGWGDAALVFASALTHQRECTTRSTALICSPFLPFSSYFLIKS